ncbi:MAG: DUF3465 domain-containing protein [Gemmatimonadaceae bacterium]
MRKLLLPAVVVAALAFFAYSRHDVPHVSAAPTANAAGNDAVFANAFDKQINNIQVEGQGTVVKILPDDNEGGRHQRFIVRLKAGQTIMIAHNIDLAARVSSLQEGDKVAFSGEYEWSPKGGVVHWTHRDPNGRHQAGWIKHDGKSFQ